MSTLTPDHVEIECGLCSYIFEAHPNSVYFQEQMCGSCLLEKQPWRKCKDCRHIVSTNPCFICRMYEEGKLDPQKVRGK